MLTAMTRHTITTRTDELGPTEVDVTIEYDFSPAEPNVNYPDTLEFVSAKASEGFIIDQDALNRWAETWLHGVGHDLAVANAVKREGA